VFIPCLFYNDENFTKVRRFTPIEIDKKFLHLENPSLAKVVQAFERGVFLPCNVPVC